LQGCVKMKLRLSYNMLRSFFIFLSKVSWMQRLITNWRFAWRAASRFVAGNTSQEAIGIVRDLNKKGFMVTLDILGESTTTDSEAVHATDQILELLDQVHSSGIIANVSVKLSQIGLALDEALCESNLEKILARARQYQNFVRIDMEDSPFTDKTLQLYRHMCVKGFDNSGVVIQSYLFRSEADTKALLGEDTRIRLVKGAYKEPSTIAFPKKPDVDANYDLLARMMIEQVKKSGSRLAGEDGRFPPIPAIATHDADRIALVKKELAELGLPKTAVEFQMLYGIRRDLQDQCIEEGYPVRIYVPFGTHWYAYFMRRLAERPANVWFFISNFFHK
jgi:proline dehydrogenase